jgi:hypothetical protein
VAQQPAGVIGREGTEVEPRERIERRHLTGPNGDEERDLLSEQPSRCESECIGGGPVKPMGVVEDHEDGELLCCLDEQGQRRGADDEGVRFAFLERKRRSEGLPLNRWDPREQLEHRAEQLVQARERELQLGLDSRRGEDPHVSRVAAGLCEERGLAHAGVADDDQRSAASAPCLVEESRDAPQLPFPPDEHTLTVLDRHD